MYPQEIQIDNLSILFFFLSPHVWIWAFLGVIPELARSWGLKIFSRLFTRRVFHWKASLNLLDARREKRPSTFSPLTDTRFSLSLKNFSVPQLDFTDCQLQVLNSTQLTRVFHQV